MTTRARAGLTLGLWALLILPAGALAQLLPQPQGLGATVTPAGTVQMVDLVDPIAGFVVTVPTDWDMTTGIAGDRLMGINVRTGGSLRSPSVTFVPVSGTLDQAAGAMVAYVKGIDDTARPVPRPGPGPNEYELITTMRGLTSAPTGVYGVAREQSGVVYIVMATGPLASAPEFKAEIDAVVRSFHPIQRQTLQVFREPNEGAYTMLMPQGWTCQGRIYRDATCPGAFVWTAQSADCSMGAFEVEPACWATSWTDAQAMAAGVLAQRIAPRVPQARNLRLDRVETLPRAAGELANWYETTLTGMGQIPTDRARVDYLAEVGNVTVRIRVDLYLTYYPLPMGQGWEAPLISGAWAPADRFAELYPLGRGVRDSLRVERVWSKLQMAAVQSVLKDKKVTTNKTVCDWDSYIRGTGVWEDPETGKSWNVPKGPGTLYKDQNGQLWWVAKDSNYPIPSTWRKIADT